MMPQPAGGIADLLARGVAQTLTDELGQPFIVENRLGASGNLAAAAVAKSAPDGNTLLFATQAQVAFNKLMFASLPYDPERDLVPVFWSASRRWCLSPAWMGRSKACRR